MTPATRVQTCVQGRPKRRPGCQRIHKILTHNPLPRVQTGVQGRPKRRPGCQRIHKILTHNPLPRVQTGVQGHHSSDKMLLAQSNSGDSGLDKHTRAIRTAGQLWRPCSIDKIVEHKTCPNMYPSTDCCSRLCSAQAQRWLSVPCAASSACSIAITRLGWRWWAGPGWA